MNQHPQNSNVYQLRTFSKQPILNHILRIDYDDAYAAKVIAHHRAPDIYAMLFGTEARPKMNLA